MLDIGPLSSYKAYTRYALKLRSQEQCSSLLLFKLASQDGKPALYAMEEACPHAGKSLASAEIEDGQVIVCPWHRYDFDMATGDSETGLQLCVYKVELSKDDHILLETPPGADDWRLETVQGVSEKFAEVPIELEEETLSMARVTLKEPEPTNILQHAVRILQTPSPGLKVARTKAAFATLDSTLPTPSSTEAEESALAVKDLIPPREATKGGVVEPGRQKRRGKGGTEKSRNLMLHALATIEQWAIDLSWDIIARYANFATSNGYRLPPAFFHDWARVAADEAKHFSLLVNLLKKRGVTYGDFETHAGLWESAQETSNDLRARLAIIHLVHEARGLDVNPLTIEKFRKAGDMEAVEVLTTIHRDEITHVTCGHRWFTWICAHENLDPVETFRAQVKKHFYGRIKGPFNHADRATTGMSENWYEDLEGRGWETHEITEEIHPRLT